MLVGGLSVVALAVVVFIAAAVMMLIGAAASMFNPGRYGTEAGADNAA